MDNLDYGKKITTESYFANKLKSTRVEYSIPKLIQDKTQALSEVMKAIDLIATKQTNDITIIIESDPKTGQFKLLTKKYTITL